MIEHLNNRTGLMKDNALALRVMEALKALDPSDFTSDDAWTYIEDTPTSGFDINAFGGLYASDDLLHISLYRCVLHPDGLMRVVTHDAPMGSATMTMDSMKALFGVSLRLD